MLRRSGSIVNRAAAVYQPLSFAAFSDRLAGLRIDEVHRSAAGNAYKNIFGLIRIRRRPPRTHGLGSPYLDSGR